MSFVGTRPEATKYVEKYSNEMLATLLLPAGITSEASIRYKDEAELLDSADDVDRVYIVIGVLTQSELYEKTISNMVECKSRGAYLMGLTTYTLVGGLVASGADAYLLHVTTTRNPYQSEDYGSYDGEKEKAQ